MHSAKVLSVITQVCNNSLIDIEHHTYKIIIIMNSSYIAQISIINIDELHIELEESIARQYSTSTWKKGTVLQGFWKANLRVCFFSFGATHSEGHCQNRGSTKTSSPYCPEPLPQHLKHPPRAGWNSSTGHLLDNNAEEHPESLRCSKSTTN